ncbi:H-2 class II histocompatibility antigen, A-U alpha chain-like isoform X1 [Hippocampus zosterae]|uniref:H-2 class II histocompatibility antigen, A-U alpha chain-like isoform X1 n=1 Tax=Hippocampus zosterae TaxID=109293 RepID=UPI00223CF7DA|nr:H-2 class II histocompatibility antigen, A-U alpha chain-like isoform X1 [Hippocampus zosterae]
MNLSTFFILILECLRTCSQFLVDTKITVSCSADTNLEGWTDNGNEIAYLDYVRKEIVYTVPTFIMLDPQIVLKNVTNYNHSKRDFETCRSMLLYFKEDIKYPGDVEDPPQTVIYFADEVLQGEENTLICLVDQFFPPNIRVHWTKNGIEVSEGVSLSRYYPNEDATFRQLSTLTFTPKEGDIYGCTVEHSALDRPKTIFWEVEFSHPGVGADVFCGAGLTVALFGVASGVFWGIRGSYATPVL